MTALEEYDALWNAARSAFHDGGLTVDRAPVDGGPRWGISLVMIPPPPLVEALADVSARLGRAYTGPQHLHDPHDLHLTVTSLEPYRDEVDRAMIDHYVDAVEQSRDLLDLHVRVVGLGGSPAGVFAQGLDDDTLLPIRRRMRRATADLHDGVPTPMAFIRNTAHISLSVHRRAEREPAAADFVERHRRTPLGEMTGARIALVRYRARGDAIGVEVLHTVLPVVR
ncbi:MAG: hypothetical protein INR72_16320 [Williamsia herbipolensis]|nr:hypothetical protein [Williamsia herbipolensis]